MKPHQKLLLVSVLWAFSYVIAKELFAKLSPEVLVFLRVFGAGLILGILTKVHKMFRRLKFKDFLFFSFLAFLGIVVDQYFFLKGLSLTTATNSSLLLTTIPLFTLVISLLLGKERLNQKKIFGLVLAISGVFVLLEIEKLNFSNKYFLGNFLILINSLGYSFYLVLIKDKSQKINPLELLAFLFFLAFFQLFPIVISDVAAFDWHSLEPKNFASIFYIVVISTTITYSLNLQALKELDSSEVALYVYLQPVLTSFLAYFFLGEVLSLRIFIGGFLTIFGVFLVSYQTKKTPLKIV
ncbi:DMT family transporter [bacterium]|nr:DMT family transporter [bacterium]